MQTGSGGLECNPVPANRRK